MKGNNLVHLRGRVGAMPFVRYTGLKTCVARFSVATHRQDDVDESDGMVGHRVTEWHSIMCFNDLARRVDLEIETGDMVEVEGRLTYEEVQLPSGERIKAARVEAKELTLLGRKKEAPVCDAPRETSTNPYGKYLDTLSGDAEDGVLPF